MSALPDKLSRSRSSPASTGGSNGNDALILSPILQIAGKLGMSGLCCMLTLLIIGCAGFDAAMAFSPAAIALGLASTILTIIAFKQAPDAWILASAFTSFLSLSGGALEFAVWMHWRILS